MPRLDRSKGGIALLAVAALLLGGCGGSSEESGSTSADGKKLIPVTVATSKDPQVATPLIVAVEQGFFEDHGLDVTVQYFDTGGEIAAAAASGDIKFGVTGDAPAINLRASGTPVRLLAQTADISGSQAIYVHPDVMTDPAAKLRGATIGSIPGTTLDEILLSTLQVLGMDSGDVEVAALQLTDMITAYKRGDIVALATVDPFTITLEQAGAKLLTTANYSHIPGNEGPHHFAGIHALAWAQEDFIEQNRETVESFMSGLIDAAKFISTDDDAVTSAVQKGLADAGRPYEADDIAKMISHNEFQVNLNQEMIDDEVENITFLHEQGALKEQVDVNEWMDASILEAIDESLVP
jgi:NitT/TauT family transport system substrate-binding protein